MSNTKIQNHLPSLDEARETLDAVERRYSTETRIAQTQAALAANERLARDPRRVAGYYAYLGRKDMFRPIYGIGHFPHGLPVALPPYLMEILDASGRVLLAFARAELRAKGPGYLIERMPAGWLAPAMAEKLYDYYLSFEPDLAFDVLVRGAHARRGISFEEFLDSGDWLEAKLLEAQSVDTYYGWWREYLRASREIGLGAGHRFTLDTGPDGQWLDDEALDRQTLAALNYPVGDDPGAVLFLEVDPETQPSAQNLVFMAEAMGGGGARRPVILDPRDLEVRNGHLYVQKPGFEREIRKVISRLVDVDLKSYIAAREAEDQTHVLDLFKQIYALPQLWGDPSKHFMGFYLLSKLTLTELSRVEGLRVASPTTHVTPEHLEGFRRDPARLSSIVIKPLLGMSAKGVIVGPTLAELEESVAREPMLAQDLFWATPLLPDINPEERDPDVRAGVCVEARLLTHGGSPAVAHNPQRARTVGALSRSHFQSADHRRRIRHDRAGRGWYSNISAILAVKAELGLAAKLDAGVGMAPIYWLD